MISLPKKLVGFAAVTAIASLTIFAAPAVYAKPNKQLVAAAVSADRSLSAEARQFYADRNYRAIRVGNKNKARAKALIAAVSSAGAQGLPPAQYKVVIRSSRS